MNEIQIAKEASVGKENKVYSEEDIRKINFLLSNLLSEIDDKYKGKKLDFLKVILFDLDLADFDFKNEENVHVIDNTLAELKTIDNKLDNVCKEIVDKHSIEFLQILGFLRQMHKLDDISVQSLYNTQDLLMNTHDFLADVVLYQEKLSK